MFSSWSLWVASTWPAAWNTPFSMRGFACRRSRPSGYPLSLGRRQAALPSRSSRPMCVSHFGQHPVAVRVGGTVWFADAGAPSGYVWDRGDGRRAGRCVPGGLLGRVEIAGRVQRLSAGRLCPSPAGVPVQGFQRPTCLRGLAVRLHIPAGNRTAPETGSVEDRPRGAGRVAACDSARWPVPSAAAYSANAQNPFEPIRRCPFR